MNISFAMTTEQFLNGSKSVTRRNRWLNLKSNTPLVGVEKGMGLKKGEKIKRLGEIMAICVRREPLNAMTIDEGYGRLEVIREGFPEMTPGQFVEMYCDSHAKTKPSSIITRIEFIHTELHLDRIACPTCFAMLPESDCVSCPFCRSVFQPMGMVG